MNFTAHLKRSKVFKNKIDLNLKKNKNEIEIKI